MKLDLENWVLGPLFLFLTFPFLLFHVEYQKNARKSVACFLCPLSGTKRQKIV